MVSAAIEILAKYTKAKKILKFPDKYDKAERMLRMTLQNLKIDNTTFKDMLKSERERHIYLTMMHYQDLRYNCDLLLQGISRKESARAKRIKEFNYIKQHEPKKRRR